MRRVNNPAPAGSIAAMVASVPTDGAWYEIEEWEPLNIKTLYSRAQYVRDVLGVDCKVSGGAAFIRRAAS